MAREFSLLNPDVVVEPGSSSSAPSSKLQQFTTDQVWGSGSKTATSTSETQPELLAQMQKPEARAVQPSGKSNEQPPIEKSVTYSRLLDRNFNVGEVLVQENVEKLQILVPDTGSFDVVSAQQANGVNAIVRHFDNQGNFATGQLPTFKIPDQLGQISIYRVNNNNQPVGEPQLYLVRDKSAAADKRITLVNDQIQSSLTELLDGPVIEVPSYNGGSAIAFAGRMSQIAGTKLDDLEGTLKGMDKSNPFVGIDLGGIGILQSMRLLSQCYGANQNTKAATVDRIKQRLEEAKKQNEAAMRVAAKSPTGAANPFRQLGSMMYGGYIIGNSLDIARWQDIQIQVALANMKKITSTCNGL